MLACLVPGPLWADADAREMGTYRQNMKYDLARGLKNIMTFPGEILVSFQKYHERSGPPVVRQMVGILDGTVRSVQRLASGAYDLGVAAWWPGYQEGFPVKPETLFELL